MGDAIGAKAETALKRPGIAQCDGERPMPAHGMAGDALAAHVGGQVLGDQLRQLMLDVGAHAIILRPRLLRRIHVEAGAEAEIVGAFRIVGHALAARAGVGRDQDQAELRGDPLRARLDGEVLLRAGEPGEEPHHRHLGVLRLRRNVNRHAHGRAGFTGSMTVDELRAAEAARLRDDLETQPCAPAQ